MSNTDQENKPERGSVESSRLKKEEVVLIRTIGQIIGRDTTVHALEPLEEGETTYRIQPRLPDYRDMSIEEYNLVKTLIKFQDGPIKENGVNGICIEDLLEIIQDRLQIYQSGDYACDENQEALVCITTALHALNRRTNKRIGRDVEGTSEI